MIPTVNALSIFQGGKLLPFSILNPVRDYLTLAGRNLDLPLLAIDLVVGSIEFGTRFVVLNLTLGSTTDKPLGRVHIPAECNASVLRGSGVLELSNLSIAVAASPTLTTAVVGKGVDEILLVGIQSAASALLNTGTANNVARASGSRTSAKIGGRHKANGQSEDSEELHVDGVVGRMGFLEVGVVSCEELERRCDGEVIPDALSACSLYFSNLSFHKHTPIPHRHLHRLPLSTLTKDFPKILF